MKKNMNIVLKTGIGIFSIYLIYCLTDPNLWSASEFTVYQAGCNDHKNYYYSCSKQVVLTKFTYRAIPESQIVIVKSGGLFLKHDQCTVYDKKNWYCESGASKELLALDDGRISVSNPSVGTSDPYASPKQISRFEYSVRSLVTQ